MKKFLVSVLVIVILLVMFGFRNRTFFSVQNKEYISQLRFDYSSGDYSRWEKPHIDTSVLATFKDIGLLPSVEFPLENPFSEEKKELGKMLFFDPRLSRSKQISCASCHDSELGWADGRTVSFGHDRKAGTRNSMSLLNVGLHTTFFWDGRASTLEEQLLFPLTDPAEMHSSEAIAVKNIRKIKGYKAFFKKAFGDEKITFERIVKAITTYERTIASRQSKFDRFISGESRLFSDEEVYGLHLFRTKARCINCHNTPLFSNQQFHNLGLSYYGRTYEDLGRYNITKEAGDVGRFKTPSLREVGRTSPYMHNGFVPSLEGVLNMYNAGMPRPKPNKKFKDDPLFPVTDSLLQPLGLTNEELKALEAFLHTLSSSPYRDPIPKLP